LLKEIRIMLRHWLNRMAQFSQGVRGRAASSDRHRHRLVLESLEGRVVPSTVTNLNDSGPGSLRQAIIDTPSGGTVDFQLGLSGTITLMTGELLINKDLTIAGPGAALIRISANHASRVFEIAPSISVSISMLTMADGRVVGMNAQGGGVWNAGTLTVTDSTVSGSSASGYHASGGGIYNTNAGMMTVSSSNLSGNSASDPFYHSTGGGIENTGTLTVTDSTVSGNSALNGGGVYNDFGGTLTVSASSLSGNSAENEGAGIYNYGMLTVIGSTLSGNSAFGDGGGIASYGTLTVTGSTLSGNFSGNAGGGIANYGTLTVTASTLSGNTAHAEDGADGGGIASYGTLTVTDSTLSDNFADRAGGGIESSGTLTVTSSTLRGNHAWFGGGIHMRGGTLSVNSSTLSANAVRGRDGADAYLYYDLSCDCYVYVPATNGADGFGGAIAVDDGTVSVISSTLSGNVAAGGLGGGPDGQNGHGYGAGISNFGTLTLNNSTLSANNSADSAGGIFMGGLAQETTLRNTILAGNTASSSPDVLGRLNSQGHNLIGNTQGGTGFDPTDLLNINPLLGPLQDNGGPTKTMALLPGSPAIDAGDNTDAPEWDQRGPGYPRITARDPVIDIGAFEVQQGGGGPASSPHARPVRFDVVGLVGIPPWQQPVGQIASEARPDVAPVDAVFANDRTVQPGVVDDLTPWPTHRASRLANSVSAQVLDRVFADSGEDFFEQVPLVVWTMPGLSR
jgi:hypothetical protein